MRTALFTKNVRLLFFFNIYGNFYKKFHVRHAQKMSDNISE